MKAVILAAGKGIRMQPLSLTRPKPMLKVCNKTLLQHNLEQLKGIVDEAIIVIGYKGEMIKEHLGEEYEGIKISYAQQKEQLGTGDALACTKDILCKNNKTERFIVMNGDDLFSSKDIKECVKKNYCMLVKKVDDPKSWGIIEPEEDNSKVKKIIEKSNNPPSNLANCGFYVLDTTIFEKDLKKSKRGEFEIVDYINLIASKGEMYYEEVKDYWLPIGFPWNLLDANKMFLERINKSEVKAEVEDNVTIKGNVIIKEGTILKSGTYIEGPVMIGKDCVIGPNCYIRNGTTLGDNCKVGQASEVKNTIVMDNSKIPHLSYIGDSVIGENVNLGAGTITGNLRHDNKECQTEIDGRLIVTGRRKLGTIIGDGVHTGIHTSIYPGRKIWPGKSTKPGEIVTKDII